ncbi:hypothetical protein FNV43_RR20171 [Rhamnella rubrinervis]|uniref:F-box domain-containing protein n=1 Tax=Rhamnella rubrinervis TaxID=2594499 RepID=A0A8K0DZV5_9ROSA|nr:hypothetical protein FNV43_RR20171 [Rhamnella rubrinervis]
MGKRGKVEKMGRRGKDDACINGLPDEILVRILCLLSLEEAIRTAILSRRWKNLWMNVPKLEISWRNDPYVFRPHEMSEVKAKVNFVNDFMKLHERTTTSLEELTICLPLDSKYSDDINKWAEVAAVKRVKKLKLDFDIEDMRSFLFSMKDTSAYYCFLAPPSSIGLYWLKDLYLRGVNVVDKVIECLFSNSPFIERFCLHYSQKLHKLEIADAPNLKFLELIFCDHLEHFQISAPNLNAIMLSVRGCPVHLNLYAPSLCHAALRTVHSFMNVWGYNMFDYLVKMLLQFCQVNKTLTIGFSSDVAITICETFDFSHQLPELSTVENSSLFALYAPFLQKLSIKVMHIRDTVSSRHMELQEVELIDFVGSRNELEIVLFVLEIASLVEKLVHARSRRTAEEETMSPVDLRMMKSTDILTAMLGIMLIISLSELMSDMQGTQMKSDGTLEESGEAQRYRNFLEEMADESEHKSANLLREGGLLDSALSAIPEKIMENSSKCIAQSAVDVAGVVMQALLARNDAVRSNDHITSLRKICPMVSSEITFEASTAEVEGYGAPKLAVDHTVIYLQLVKSISRKLSSFTFVHACWNLLFQMDGNHTLHIIPDSRQVKADELEPGVCYLQITAADPLMEDEDLGSRTERIFSLSTGSVRACVFDHFLFDTLFTKNGKSHGGLEDQWKRRTVLQTGGSFVALFNGLRSLMRNLQGSVAVQLISQFSPDNSGVLSFCTAFLSGEPATRLRVHELQQLIAVLFEFMAVCKHAIRVHFRLIGEEDQEFHTQLVKGFQSLTAE